MPGRTWVIAPDKQSLEARWKKLTGETDLVRKEVLFHPHMRDGKLADKHLGKLVGEGLQAHEFRPSSVAKDLGKIVTPTRYGFRSFDRQWIIPDSRLLNQPNPTLWAMDSAQQVYLISQHPTIAPRLQAQHSHLLQSFRICITMRDAAVEPFHCGRTLPLLNQTYKTACWQDLPSCMGRPSRLRISWLTSRPSLRIEDMHIALLRTLFSPVSGYRSPQTRGCLPPR